jgi:AraC-like DNA-binding protein
MVRRAMVEAGLAADEPVGAADALLPLAFKRDLLSRIAETHGLRPLLEAGRQLTRVGPDPALTALLAAADAADLFERWSRLERFVHSRHRVLVREVGERHLVAEHVSTAAEPPRAPEDALIMGVIAAALVAVGATGVCVRLGAAPEAPVVLEDGVAQVPMGGSTAVWRFEWNSWASCNVSEARAQADIAAALRAAVAGDPARGWTVNAAAAMLGTSARSLQRRLAPVGGFGTLVGGVRAERAGDLLVRTAYPLSLVGFACGYADQPHFTREFRRRAAMTPAAFRNAFARAA